MCHTSDMEKQHLTLRIEPQVTDKLDRGWRAVRKLSVGWLVRQAIEEYLAREERTKT